MSDSMHRALIALLALTACGGTSLPATLPAHATGGTELDARFVDAVRGAAVEYRTWTRLDDQLRQAPTLCAAPATGPQPPTLRRSAAGNGPHARKLYTLWPSSTAAYTATDAVPVGFAVVKESFAAVVVDATHPGPAPTVRTPEGEYLTAGDRTDLFVMTKVATGADTDAGWIYGTVSPDGTVTSAGRVASCMGCHDPDAKRERLFGVRR